MAGVPGLTVSVAVFTGTAVLPGLTVPVMALPSQSRINRILSPWTELPAHSPSHEPFNGWPSCAAVVPSNPNAKQAAASAAVSLFVILVFSIRRDEIIRIAAGWRLEEL